MKAPTRRILWATLLVLAGTSGCGTAVYRPAQSAGFELEPVGEINDEDVQKAFDARPQLPARLAVAYYTFDDEYADDIERMLQAMPMVSSTYRIPTLLVTGKRRFDEPAWGAPPAPPLSIKKLRLMAARARADVLLVFDYGYRVSYGPNGLVAFAILVVPMFFLPLQDVVAESYLETYVIDTRNGYLYGQVTTERKTEEDYLFIYSDRGQELVDAQRDELVAEARRRLGELLTRTASPGAPAKVPALPGPGATPPLDPGSAGARLQIDFGPAGELIINGARLASLAEARAWVAAAVQGREAEARIQLRPGLDPERVQELVELLRSLEVRSISVERAPAASVSSSSPPAKDEGILAPRLPNPASGEPSRVTPPPSLSPSGSATPISPLPIGR